MPQPIESLDRSTLERRYRRVRVTAVLLGAATLFLGVALATQGPRTAALNESSTSGSNSATTSTPGAKAPGEGDSQCPVEDRRDASDPRGLGDVDAPIVLHEWTDFRCPYCGAFSRDTLPVLIDEYVKTGKVRLEIHDAALVGGDNSVLIAAAARAAGAQGKYFEFYDAVYQASTKQSDSHPEFDAAALTELARSVGVPDIAAFTQALERDEFSDAVRAETAEAQRIGVTGVPFFATSGCGKVVSGAQSVDAFRASLDEALAAAKG